MVLLFLALGLSMYSGAVQRKKNNVTVTVVTVHVVPSAFVGLATR